MMLNQPHNFEPSQWMPLRCKFCMGFAGDTRHQTVKAPRSDPSVKWLPAYTFTSTDLTFLNLVERGVTYEEYARGGFDDD